MAHIQFLGRCLSARFCTWDIFVYQQPFSVYAYHRPTYLDVDRLKLMGPDILLKVRPPMHACKGFLLNYSLNHLGTAVLQKLMHVVLQATYPAQRYATRQGVFLRSFAIQ